MSDWQKAREILLQGGVVAVPTETVFGLLGRADRPEVIHRIYSVKGRPADKPLVLMVPDLETARRYGEFNPAAQRLAERFWPGPLTLVVPATPHAPQALVAHGTIGIRVPDHPKLLQLLRALAGVPVASTSANPSGAPPAQQPEEVQRALGEAVDLVVPEPAGGQPPSTVVRTSEDPPRVLRKGALPVLALEEALEQEVRLAPDQTFHVLYLCTGNTCRSPMAEWITKHLMTPGVRSHLAVLSAGTDAVTGSPIHPDAARVLEEVGIQVRGHRAQPLTPTLVQWADVIYGMEYRHVEAAKKQGAGVKARLFGEKTVGEIPDPIGQGVMFYRMVRDALLETIRKVIYPYLERKWQ